MRAFVDMLGASVRSICSGRRAWVVGLSLLVPVVLAAVLIGAFAPAFDNAERIPVAVVNLDDGKTQDGSVIDAGEDVVESLLETETLAWEVVDEDDARRGLSDGTYALALTIPEDYSRCVASLDTDEPRTATIELASAETGNALATRAGSAALRQVQARLRADVGEDYLLSVINEVRGQASRLTLTADGAVMLDAAYDGLAEGAGALADGLSQTAAGAAGLGDGLTQMADGAAAAGAGAEALGQGMQEIDAQAAQPLAQGAEALAQGMDAAADALAETGKGVTALGDGLSELGDGLAGTVGDAAVLAQEGAALEQGASTLAEALDATGAALEGAHDAAGGMTAGVSAARDTLGSLAEALTARSCELSSDAPDTPGVVERLRALDARETALYEEVRSLALADDLTADERAGRMQELDAEADAIARERTELTGRLEDVAAAEGADAAAAQAALGELPGEDDQQALAAAAAGVDEASRAVEAARDGVSSTIEDAAARSQNVARTAMGAAVALGGVAAPEGTDAPNLAATATALGAGIDALASELSSEGALGAGASGVSTGAAALGQAVAGFSQGVSALATGNDSLAAALSGMAGATEGLGSGLGAMADASNQLGQGVVSLKDAAGQMGESISQAAEGLSAVSSNPSEHAEAAARPVSISTRGVASTDGVGAMAPVAAVLALGVAALAAGLVIPPVDRRAVAAGNVAASAITQGVIYGGFGVVSALVVFAGLALMGAVPWSAAVLGVLVLASLALSALAWALRAASGRYFAALWAAVLAVQAACAGVVLPAALTSGLFAALGTMVPLGAAAEALRGVAAGAMGTLAGPVAVLVMWLVASVACVCVLTAARRTLRPGRA